MLEGEHVRIVSRIIVYRPISQLFEVERHGMQFTTYGRANNMDNRLEGIVNMFDIMEGLYRNN